MGDNLGVGVRHEPVTSLEHLTAQLLVVFDDPVMDHGEAPSAVEVWMGVRLGHPAVGGPASVTQADRARRERRAGLSNRADGLFERRDPVPSNGDPPRVVAPIFQLAKALQNDLGGIVSLTNVAKYSAHAR